MSSIDSKGLKIVGIDPGLKGYFVGLNEASIIEDRYAMPVNGKKIDPYGVWLVLKTLRLRAAERGQRLIFGLEKAFTMPSDKKSSELISELRRVSDVVKQNGILDELDRVLKASDGRVGVFSYGIGYGYLLMGLAVLGVRVELYHPATWQKVMHKGCEKGLNAKQRSLQAGERLWGKEALFPEDKGRMRVPPDGLVDAALIAETLRRQMVGS